jgi:hypothetical protein
VQNYKVVNNEVKAHANTFFFWNNMPIPIYIYCTVIQLNYASFYQTKLNVIYDILKDPFHNKSQD